jgi:uncharacterized protein
MAYIAEQATPRFVPQWHPRWRELGVVILSWLLVVAALRVATSIVTPDREIFYFLVYGILGATVIGIGIPLYWMVVVQRRPIADLGLTFNRWKLSLTLQAILAVALYFLVFRGVTVPPTREFVPLLALVLAIGFFEAVFWRGWVMLRLEESFGLLPAILVGSLLYAAYHVCYAMSVDEMIFLFFIGIMFAVVFLITKSVLVLWPAFQPLGQLVTLIEDELTLPFIATLGFLEVLFVMLVLVVLAHRVYVRRQRSITTAEAST